MYRVWLASIGSFLGTFYGMNEQHFISRDNSLRAVVVSGLSNRGGESFDRTSIVPFAVRPEKVLAFHSSYFKQDLGQHACIKQLAKNLAEIDVRGTDQLWIAGCSMGTAALLRYVSSKSAEEQERVYKLLFLEGVLFSGNHAIRHFVEHALSFPGISFFPYVRYWLPLGAKSVFPSYNPLDSHLKESVNKLSSKIPVIVLHGPHDPFTPVDGALRLYCLLRTKGTDVYLIEGEPNVSYKANKNRHLNILLSDATENRNKKIAAIQKVYKKYGLPYNQEFLNAFMQQYTGTEDTLLQEFQPSVKAIEQRLYHRFAWKEALRNCIDYATTVALLCSAYLGYREWGKSGIDSLMTLLYMRLFAKRMYMVLHKQ